MAGKKFMVNWSGGLKMRTEPEPTNRTFTGFRVPHGTVVDAIGEPHQYDDRFTFQKVHTPDGKEGWLTYRDGATTYLDLVEVKEEKVVQPPPEPPAPQTPSPKPKTSGLPLQYAQGPAYQYDKDDPVRPAHKHADKNINLRGYVPSTASFKRELVTYGSDDPTQPPQFATLFDPPRVPSFSNFYQIRDWNWGRSPEPGTRGNPSTKWPASVLGLQVSPGEVLHVPTSGYDIGGGMEVIVIYADEETIALKYTRDDSSARGYTVHVGKISIAPNLLALYKKLDDSNGPRYKYPNQSYDLPSLPAGQPFGTAKGTEIVVAIVDTGTFMDARSCDEWWQIRPGYTGSCPRA